MGVSFIQKCRSLPPSGGGGCHPALLGATNAGVREGLSEAEILSTIREHLDDSARPVSDKEILDTIITSKASNGTAPSRSRKSWDNAPAVQSTLIDHIINEAPHATATDLVNLSKVPIPPDPQQQTMPPGKESGQDLKYMVGTMIEVPRAALTADEIAKEAEFFSFGTNDLTQMTFGFSRDDAGKFLEAYYEKKIFDGILGAKDTEKLSDLKNQFYVHLKKIKDKLYHLVIKKGYFPFNPDKVRGTYLGIGLAVIFLSFAA